MGIGTGPIDSSGVLPDGTKFNGPAGLREVLVSKQDMFVETFTEQLLTYALGRGVEEYDAPVLRQITREAVSEDYRWSSIILGIVNSAPFQMRRVKRLVITRKIHSRRTFLRGAVRFLPCQCWTP